MPEHLCGFVGVVIGIFLELCIDYRRLCTDVEFYAAGKAVAHLCQCALWTFDEEKTL